MAFTDPPKRWEIGLYRFVRVLILAVAKVFCRIEVHGREHVRHREARGRLADNRV